MPVSGSLRATLRSASRSRSRRSRTAIERATVRATIRRLRSGEGTGAVFSQPVSGRALTPTLSAAAVVGVSALPLTGWHAEPERLTPTGQADQDRADGG